MSLENPCTFLLVKEKTWKRIFNTNSELSQNRTEKQIMPLKTTVNWLFNYIWRYLVISCFDWKIGVFPQTVVRFYCILKIFSFSFLYFSNMASVIALLILYVKYPNKENNQQCNIKVILKKKTIHVKLEWPGILNTF